MRLHTPPAERVKAASRSNSFVGEKILSWWLSIHHHTIKILSLLSERKWASGWRRMGGSMKGYTLHPHRGECFCFHQINHVYYSEFILRRSGCNTMPSWGFSQLWSKSISYEFRIFYRRWFSCGLSERRHMQKSSACTRWHLGHSRDYSFGDKKWSRRWCWMYSGDYWIMCSSWEAVAITTTSMVTP